MFTFCPTVPAPKESGSELHTSLAEIAEANDIGATGKPLAHKAMLHRLSSVPCGSGAVKSSKYTYALLPVCAV